MRWFRLRQRWGSCLALVALLIQLVVTAGHVHLDHVSPHAHEIAAASAATGPEAPNNPQAPDQDHCPACALIHLAHALLAPAAPVLPLPVAFNRPELVVGSAGPTTSQTARFRARAPPIA